MTEAMAIKALAPWFGSKRGLACRIVEALGDHRYYCEPFCGSLAVLLAKPPAQHEVACDLHGDLTNLAWVLQAEATASWLFGELSRTLADEELFRRSASALKTTLIADHPELIRAYHFMVASWLGRSGEIGTSPQQRGHNLAVRWTPGGGPTAKRFRSAIESIPAWCQRLRNVLILRRDGFEVLAKLSDEPGVAVYADPPYPREVLAGDARYEHDFQHDGSIFGTDDHARLAERLRAFQQARVVVSCYDCERYRQLYEGWSVIDCTTTKHMPNAAARGSQGAEPAREVLFVNNQTGDTQ
jgi:DNA adenine methylase